ncbi:unnamed protein product [Toxocara canis]|uniref:Uncharacterized protein n=1 Tax=Toxocara canis TaxID=6265 RepID=A0A183UAD0_TOXCA|nr:unnamed protein product [Toxocara canis]
MAVMQATRQNLIDQWRTDGLRTAGGGDAGAYHGWVSLVSQRTANVQLAMRVGTHACHRFPPCLAFYLLLLHAPVKPSTSAQAAIRNDSKAERVKRREG